MDGIINETICINIMDIIDIDLILERMNKL